MAYIYVVEDDNNISEIEGFALKNAGHTVIECASGKDFHKLMRERIPDLVLLDIMLPDEDGLEILRKLRQVPETRRVPVIMVTAKTTEIDKVKGLDMGADDYITKPFGIMELISRVKAVLRRAGGTGEEKLIIVLTRDNIMDRIWSTDYEGESRTLDVHIKTLRHKLGDAGNYIKTVRNVGYFMDDEAH